MLLIHGHSFSSLENGPGWAVPFYVGKWFDISNRQSFSILENDPYRKFIFIMKMV
jgi:hypothetical protein